MADFLLSGYSFTMWLIKIFAAIAIFLIILAFVTIFSAGEVSTYKLEADTLVQSIFYSISYLDPLTQKTSLGVINSNFVIPKIESPESILIKLTLYVDGKSSIQYFPNRELFETYEVVKNFKQQIYKKSFKKNVFVKDKNERGMLIFDVLVRK